MEEQLQTICFIDKTKFKALLTSPKAKALGFNSGDITQLGYIDESWKIEFGKFNQEKAEKAKYLLVSDEFPLEKNYQPKKMLKFLIHGRTNRKKRIDPFEKFFPFFKVTQESEDFGSEYDKIAEGIISKNLHKNE